MKDKRNQIDEIDEQIVELLAKRMNLVKEIGRMKNESGTNITDEEREKKIRERLKVLVKENELSEEFVNNLYTRIFMESRRIQNS